MFIVLRYTVGMHVVAAIAFGVVLLALLYWFGSTLRY
jgi:hypothetical protein